MCANIAPRKPTPESRQPARKPVRRPRAPRCEPELAARFRGHQRAGGKLLRKCFVKTRFHHDFSARTAGRVSGKRPEDLTNHCHPKTYAPEPHCPTRVKDTKQGAYRLHGACRIRWLADPPAHAAAVRCRYTTTERHSAPLAS